MKKILLISLIFVGFVVTSFAQDSNPKRLALGFYGGIQVPGYGDEHLGVGPWFGIFVNLPTGLGWSLQLEYNFWKSSNYSRDPDQNLYATEIPLLIGYRIDFTNTYFQALFGPGIVSSNYYLFTGANDDFLVSFDVALKIGLVLSNNFDGFLQLRKQWSGSLNAGGGPSYNPWLVGLGIEYKFD